MLISSNVNSSRQEALLYVFEDNEAVIEMIIKGRSPTMRHVSRTHRVALDWLVDRIYLDTKIQIKYIDTENQLADILTQGNFTRDEWNHLLCLFNISHFSFTNCLGVMSKRTQKESGEERVTAKSRPMMSLIARAPSTLSSSVSESPGKRSYESQSPWSTIAEKEERSGRPDETSWRATREIRPGFSHEETLHDGTAQSVVNEVTPRDRRGRPDIDSQEEARPQQLVIGNDEAELELSVESRSFVNRVNDQVRKRQKRISNATEDGEKLYDLGNVHDCNNGISGIHGKELPEQLSIHREHNRSHT